MGANGATFINILNFYIRMQRRITFAVCIHVVFMFLGFEVLWTCN